MSSSNPGARSGLRTAVCVAVPLALASVAPAAAQAPPTTLVGAAGPLVGGQSYSGRSPGTGAFGGNFYYFYAGSQVQLSVQLSTDRAGGKSCGDAYGWGAPGSLTLLDRDGKELASTSLYEVLGKDVGTINYTAPVGGGLMYLRAMCGPGSTRDYSFVINPASGVTTGPPPFGTPVAETEPNDFPAQATPGLVGGQDYSGALTTNNDQDWFSFYALGQQQLDIQVTSLRECGRVELYAPDPEGGEPKSLASAHSYANQVEHLRYTTAQAPTRYLLKAGCDDGSPYQFRITPATAVTTAPAPVPAAPAEPTAHRRASTTLTARRAGRRIVGRLASSAGDCLVAEPLVLRRVGSGTRAFGRAKADARGRFAFRLPRARGRYYVVHPTRRWEGLHVTCGPSRSARVRV